MPKNRVPDRRPQIPSPKDSETLFSQLDLSDVVKIDGDKYKPLFAGGFSDVHVGSLKGNHRAPDEKVAVKVFRTGKQSQEEIESLRRRFNREVRSWKEMDHNNVLKLLGVSEKLGRKCPALITATTIQSWNTYDASLAAIERPWHVRGVAEGLAYLHSREAVHGDIKPSNILIDGKGKPLICDFGCARILTYKGFTLTTPAGTVQYQAPELIVPRDEEPSLTKATDVYAFALTSFEIWTGKEPYDTRKNYALIVEIMKGVKPTCPNPPPPLKEIFWPLLERCWVTEPGKRLTMQGAVRILASSGA